MEYVLFVDDQDHVLAVYPDGNVVPLEKPTTSNKKSERKTILIHEDSVDLRWHEICEGGERCQQ